jgi:hypothetical protein
MSQDFTDAVAIPIKKYLQEIKNKRYLFLKFQSLPKLNLPQHYTSNSGSVLQFKLYAINYIRSATFQVFNSER